MFDKLSVKWMNWEIECWQEKIDFTVGNIVEKNCSLAATKPIAK